MFFPFLESVQQLQISFSVRPPTCYCPLCEPARDEMSALSVVRTPRTHASRDFFHPPPPCEWRHRYLFSLFIFFVFPLRSISVVIFFVFQFFFFYLLYVWSFFDNFYMEMILKNYTKTYDYKLHDEFVRTKVVWEIFQITSSYNLCSKVILYKLFSKTTH